MHRFAKFCWVGFVVSILLSSLIISLTVYFTVFHVPADIRNLTDTPPRTNYPGTAPITGSHPTGGRTGSIPGRGADEKSGLYDHRSHAVPGGSYEAIDYAGAGSVSIQLDGSRSHTHYFDDGPPVVIGRIVTMTWFDNATHAVLGTGVKPRILFEVGETVVGLTVVDNTRDSHTDFAKVTVKPPIVDGVYCYYYAEGAVLNQDVAKGARPGFAARTDAVNFESAASFPKEVTAKDFIARCVFLVDVKTNMLLSFRHTGAIKLIITGKTVHASDAATSSVRYTGLPGKVDAQLIYTPESAATARLELNVGVRKFEHDVSKLVPVVLGIDPRSSTLDGGGKATIRGLALGNRLKVIFGSREAKYSAKDLEEDGSSVIVTVPSILEEGSVNVVAVNRNGPSNAIEFGFSSDGKVPIKFEETFVQQRGRTFDLQLIAGIKYGPDHRFYASSLDGYVYSFELDDELEVVGDVCRSPSLGEHRSVLGLAFNYADPKTRVYATSSILHWKTKGHITSDDGWTNGQVHVLAPGAGGKCLGEVSDPIITGLPVSSHDHGVSGLVFDDDGNLHIQAGGCTNAGHKDSRLGGIAESPLSAASLIAYLPKADFDGHVTYSSSDPAKAKQTGGFDVEVFSPGWRNSFGINIHSNGFLYATDNGPSPGFGEMSTTCSTNGQLPGNGSLADKLGKVIRGKYFGHPNRNRGRTDAKQCAFVSLDTRRSTGYQPPIATFESSTNGVLEYTANTFGGQMRGDLLLSKYTTDQSPGKTFRVTLNAAGDIAGAPATLWDGSGLTIAMSPFGDVLMPRVYKKQILALRPVSLGTKAQTFRSVMPPRGSHRGGNVVLVTGLNIGAEPVALFNGEKCTGVSDVSTTSFKCKVPRGKPGVRAVIVIESDGGTTEASEDGSGVDYKYMNI